MGRNDIFTLAILAIGMSLLSCQSDYQKMNSTLAREYQDRYNSCNISVENFSRYAGFGFVDELGVCNCNGDVCKGNEVCNMYGACSAPVFGADQECNDNDKICISPKIGQICIRQHWSAPINCDERGLVCNPQAPKNEVCAPKCSETICFEEYGKAKFAECPNESYGNVQSCNTDGNERSCTYGNNHTSKCGDCKNDDLKTEGDVTKKCINGQWQDCLLFDDSNCYTHSLCANKSDDSGSEVIVSDEKGPYAVQECTDGCNEDNSGCLNNRIKKCEMSEIKCEGTELKTCIDGVFWKISYDDVNCIPEIETDCSEKCKPGEECTDGECKCAEPNSKKCEGHDLMECKSDGSWEKLESCLNGCDPEKNACKTSEPTECTINCGDFEECIDGTCKCTEAGLKKCEGNDLKECNSDGSWKSENCSKGCDPEKNACITSEPTECTQNCGEFEECIDGTCKCTEAGLIKCEGNDLKECNSDGSWKSENCSKGCDPEKNACKTSKPTECTTNCGDSEECIDGTCKCTEPNFKKCEGNDLMKCKSDGSWEKLESCLNGCDPEKNACKTSEPTECTINCGDFEECIDGVCKCIVGKHICDDNILNICDSQQGWIKDSSCDLGCVDDVGGANARCKQCLDNQYKCEQGDIYACKKGEWAMVDETRCTGDCNSDGDIITLNKEDDISTAQDKLCNATSPCNNKPYYTCDMNRQIVLKCNEADSCETADNINIFTIKFNYDNPSVYINCYKTYMCDAIESKETEYKLNALQNTVCRGDSATTKISLNNCRKTGTHTYTSPAYVEINDTDVVYKSKVEFKVESSVNENNTDHLDFSISAMP